MLVRQGVGADSRDVEAAREAYVRVLSTTQPRTLPATAVSSRKGSESAGTDGRLPDQGESVSSMVTAEEDGLYEGEWEVEEVG